MSNSTLVAYATRYGSTQEVAEEIAKSLDECRPGVDIQPVRKVRTLSGYRAVVLGAPLYMFQWHKDALRFLSQHHEVLTERPLAIFALGPVHDPHDDAEWQDSRDQLDKALAKFPWLNPVAVEMFGGKYDPAKLGFPIKQLAGKAPATDIRDWMTIRTWAVNLAAKLDPALPNPSGFVDTPGRSSNPGKEGGNS
jgi:menaquinone-dependent protoporphyrinogen oxidase